MKWPSKFVLTPGLVCALAVFFGGQTVSGQDPVFIPPKKVEPASEKPELQEPPNADSLGRPIFIPPAKKSVMPDKVDPIPLPKSPVNPPQAQLIAPNPAPIPTDLSRSILKRIDEVVLPALKEDRHFDFLAAMSDLVSKLDKKALTSIEEYVQAQGLSIRDHFVDLLVQGIEQQEQIPVPDLKIDVVEYINSGLRKRIAAELEQLNAHPVMQPTPELPPTWRECEQLFWEVHVWKNRMQNVARLAEFGLLIQNKLLGRAQKRQDIPTVNRLQPTIISANKVQQQTHAMLEGEAMLRIAELEKAEKTLRESNDFEERIAAAFALELHGHFLDELFSNYPAGSFARPQLNQADLRDRCDDLLASGRTAGEEVIEKALLLRRGAHWWLRGRYGAGPLAEGLLKTKQAMQSEDAMFGLYMPKKRPDPIVVFTTENTISPGYDRRHYYTWAVEKRDLVRSATTTVGPSTSSTKHKPGPKSQNQFW